MISRREIPFTAPWKLRKETETRPLTFLTFTLCRRLQVVDLILRGGTTISALQHVHDTLPSLTGLCSFKWGMDDEWMDQHYGMIDIDAEAEDFEDYYETEESETTKKCFDLVKSIATSCLDRSISICFWSPMYDSRTLGQKARNIFSPQISKPSPPVGAYTQM